MISVSVYLQVGFVIKITLLCCMNVAYFVIVLASHVNLFDNRDFLLHVYQGSVNCSPPHLVVNPRIHWSNEETARG